MSRVLAGIDSLGLEVLDRLLRGKRLGLMTNPTGVDAKLRPTIDILHERYRLSALFACEHGIRGSVSAGDPVANILDPQTGVTVYSCYGASHSLPQETMGKFDVFVFDMQDAGARFYTYLYSLSYALQSCAEAGKPAVVLDRPNPLGGVLSQGTLLDEKVRSFVGMYAMPTRHGLTIGEYALWARDYLRLDLDLRVVPMMGWEREMLWEDTGLPFVPPSPNLATPHAARAYPGTCIFEGTNLSEGRGTALPFELIGAPFADGKRLEARMNALDLPGMTFRSAWFTPGHNKWAGQACQGVQVYVTDPRVADPCAAGLFLLDAVREMHPDELFYSGFEGSEYKTLDKLLGTDEYRTGKLDARGLLEKHKPLVKAWREGTRKYWLYR